MRWIDLTPPSPGQYRVISIRVARLVRQKITALAQIVRFQLQVVLEWAYARL